MSITLAHFNVALVLYLYGFVYKKSTHIRDDIKVYVKYSNCFVYSMNNFFYVTTLNENLEKIKNKNTRNILRLLTNESTEYLMKYEHVN